MLSTHGYVGAFCLLMIPLCQTYAQSGDTVPILVQIAGPVSNDVEVTKCDSVAAASLSSECHSEIPNAPLLYQTPEAKITYSTHRSGSLAFMQSFEIPGVLIVANIDFLKLQTDLRNALEAAGHEIAFSGAASSELIVTTAPGPASQGKVHYQVRLVARYCDGGSANEACGAYGGAFRIFVPTDTRKKPSTDIDSLTGALERIEMDHIRSALRRR
jgi:hypothetical protein